MSALIPLRSLGDFVIDAGIINNNPGLIKFDRVILPGYLEFLGSLINKEIMKPEILPLKVRSNILSFFTYKYFLSRDTVYELQVLREGLNNLEPEVSELLVQEPDMRNGLLSAFLGRKIESPTDSGTVYERRLELYTGKKEFDIRIQPAKDYRRVIVFPDSRLKKKEIASHTLTEIAAALKVRKIECVIAMYDNKDKVYLANKNIQYYSNLSELERLISGADLVISCDSMPLHLSNFLNKEHFCIYNGAINVDWVTPYMKATNALCISEDLGKLYKYLN